MSVNRQLPFLLLSFLCVSAAPTLHAADICPARAHASLRSVQVFDGPPQELASLVPDAGDDRTAYWQLGYVYDAGRAVFIQCKYADGSTVDEKLAHRVSRCDYSIDARNTISLQCR